MTCMMNVADRWQLQKWSMKQGDIMTNDNSTRHPQRLRDLLTNGFRDSFLRPDYLNDVKLNRYRY